LTSKLAADRFEGGETDRLRLAAERTTPWPNSSLVNSIEPSAGTKWMASMIGWQWMSADPTRDESIIRKGPATVR